MRISSTFARRAALLCLLFAAALALRTARLDLMEFKHDEAAAWILATAASAGRAFPTAGIATSKGIENFPLFVYLLAGLRLVSPDPVFAVRAIAFLNSLAVLFVYLASRKIAGARAGWIAALLYAVSPCAVFFSRKLWAQNLMPFWAGALFCCLVMLALDAPRERRDRVLSFCAGFLAATCWQIHLSGAFLVLSWLAALWVVRPRVKPLFALSGAALGVLPALPYLWHLAAAARSGGGAASALFDFSPRPRIKELLVYFPRQVVDEDFHALLGADYAAFLRAVPGYGALRWALSAAVLLGMAIAAKRTWRAERNARNRSALPLVLALAGMALMGMALIPLIPAYFMVFYPLPFLFAAVAVDALWLLLERAGAPRAARWLMTAALAAVAIGQIAYTARFVRRVDADGGTRWGYGVCYDETRRAALWLREARYPAQRIGLVDFPIWALFATEPPGPGAAAASPPFAQANDDMEMLFIDRLRNPKADGAFPDRVVFESAAYLGVLLPRREALSARDRYPAVGLTDLQVREQERLRRPAPGLLAPTRGNAARVPPAAPTAKAP
jgi:hypothetical protein